MHGFKGCRIKLVNSLLLVILERDTNLSFRKLKIQGKVLKRDIAHLVTWAKLQDWSGSCAHSWPFLKTWPRVLILSLVLIYFEFWIFKLMLFLKHFKQVWTLYFSNILSVKLISPTTLQNMNCGKKLILFYVS